MKTTTKPTTMMIVWNWNDHFPWHPITEAFRTVYDQGSYSVSYYRQIKLVICPLKRMLSANLESGQNHSSQIALSLIHSSTPRLVLETNYSSEADHVLKSNLTCAREIGTGVTATVHMTL